MQGRPARRRRAPPRRAESVTYKAIVLALAHVPAARHAGLLGAAGQAGCLRARYAARRGVCGRPADQPLRHVLTGGGLGVLVLACVARLASDVAWTFFSSSCGLAFAALLAAEVLAPRAVPTGETRRSRLLAALGTISYSLYLWHKPLLLALTRDRLITLSSTAVFALAVLTVTATAIVVAIASYWVIERPAMGLRRHFDRAGHLVTPLGTLLPGPILARCTRWRDQRDA